MEELEWSIWLKLIDMSANLQWLKWKHLFCFYCLIKWLEARSKCPYCNSEVTVDTLGTNSNLISTFNLMVEAKNDKETSWKLHKQRCDLYWKDWKYEICYECILSYNHKSHSLISLKIFVEETKDKLKALSKPDNSIKQVIENQIENIRQNKDIFNKIAYKWFKDHKKMFDEFIENYIWKIDKFHLTYINLLLLNSKRLEQNQIKINKIAEWEKIDNLNDVVLAINSMSEIEHETAIIAQKYQQCCIEEEFALIDPPIKKLFEVCTKSLENSNSFILKFKVKDLMISQLYFNKIDSKTWNIYVKTDYINDLEWYVVLDIFKEDFLNIEFKNELLKLQQNGYLFLMNKIVFKDDKINPNDKLKIELKYWKITDKLNSYSQKCEKSIKKGLQNIFI